MILNHSISNHKQTCQARRIWSKVTVHHYITRTTQTTTRHSALRHSIKASPHPFTTRHIPQYPIDLSSHTTSQPANLPPNSNNAPPPHPHPRNPHIALHPSSIRASYSSTPPTTPAQSILRRQTRGRRQEKQRRAMVTHLSAHSQPQTNPLHQARGVPRHRRPSSMVPSAERAGEEAAPRGRGARPRPRQGPSPAEHRGGRRGPAGGAGCVARGEGRARARCCAAGGSGGECEPDAVRC